MEPTNQTFQKIGYWAWGLVAVLCLVIAGIILGQRLSSTPHKNLLTVQFDNVGALMREDPVLSMGKQIGHVQSIHYASHSAKVYLKFYQPINLPQDSRIVNYNHSFMGERMIYITPGSSKQKMNPDSVQLGSFELGVGELLYQTEEMVGVMLQYQKNIHAFLYGTDSTPSLIHTYKKILYPIWNQHTSYRQQLLQIHSTLQNKLHNLSQTLVHVTQQTKVLAQQTPPILTELQNIVQNLQKLQQDKVLYNLTQPKGHAEQLAGIHQKLIFLSTLMSSNSSLKDISYNWHIWGENPSKKKKRKKEKKTLKNP